MAEKNQNILKAVGLYGKQLPGFIRGRVGANEDAEDILQDVWYQYSNSDENDAIEFTSCSRIILPFASCGAEKSFGAGPLS